MTAHIAELRHPTAGRPTAQHVYRIASGQPVLIANRFDKSDGSKIFLPYDIGTGDWKAPETRPLYRLDEIVAADENRPVLIVEGEKCADALANLGYLATTTFGGANAAHKADLSPLRGREIILWPDHDAPGKGYAEGIAARLYNLYRHSPRIVPVSDTVLYNITLYREPDPSIYPKGWDAADAITEGWTREELDKLLALAVPYSEPDRPNQEPAAGGLGELELWRTPDGKAFATIDRFGHRENWAIGSPTFLNYLSYQHFQDEGKTPSQSALDDKKRSLIGQALFAGEEHRCFTRLGEKDGALYLDLGDKDWSAIEITADGWRLTDRPAAKLQRSNSTRALPLPAPGIGDVTLLRRFVNVASEDDFRMLVAWLIGCFRPKGPYPILILTGEQGSAKSTTARVLRSLIDPASPMTRSSPRDERDLIIAATNNHVLAFDNLSLIKPSLADALCRLATGGGFGTRQLHTNTEEVLFDVTRPCLLNGIPDLASRPDLADRAIIVNLPVISEAQRQFEDTFWSEFKKASPRILSALLDAVSAALGRVNAVELLSRPRMAGFARWVTAAEPALGWPDGAFMAAYDANREAVGDAAIDGNAVATAILHLVADGTPWRGTATDLICELRSRFPVLTEDRQAFPRQASQFGADLRRVEPLLRHKGVAVTYTREGRIRTRVITLKPA